MKTLSALGALLASSLAAAIPHATPTPAPDMQLGNFSVSLTVADLAASRDFYGKLGFREVSGKFEQNWLVLQNGTVKIGLFQGMFERNMLTFNPGWDSNAKPLESFTDVRELQHRLRESGIEITVEADEATTGPAHFLVADPDGNPILFDQHVDAPG